jgi:hypothetical protein
MSQFGYLPPPTPLRRAAVLVFRWGEQVHECYCTACSVRVLDWEETGEEITWLHFKGMRIAEIKPEGATGMMNLLVPAHYVISIKPGPTFTLTSSKPSTDIGVFPPNQPTPPDRMDLEEIARVVEDLVSPELN